MERLRELRIAKTTNDEDAGPSEQPIDLFSFKSRSREGLHAFTGDRAGEQLPRQFRPWRAQGIIYKDQAPPHAFSRSAIERSSAITDFNSGESAISPRGKNEGSYGQFAR